jgi:hypothetical protein
MHSSPHHGEHAFLLPAARGEGGQRPDEGCSSQQHSFRPIENGAAFLSPQSQRRDALHSPQHRANTMHSFSPQRGEEVPEGRMRGALRSSIPFAAILKTRCVTFAATRSKHHAFLLPASRGEGARRADEGRSSHLRNSAKVEVRTRESPEGDASRHPRCACRTRATGSACSESRSGSGDLFETAPHRTNHWTRR